MSESRTDRLTRIRADLDYAAHRHPERASAITVAVADIWWLLSQVSADVEYRVEIASGPDGEPPVWVHAEAHRYAFREAAEHFMTTVAEHDRHYYRVVSAPVQVWTPVVEEDRPPVVSGGQVDLLGALRESLERARADYKASKEGQP